jgi:hypothetical protein
MRFMVIVKATPESEKEGARVKFSGKSRPVVDGHFTEAKELIAGFSILQVKSLEGHRVGHASPQL